MKLNEEQSLPCWCGAKNPYFAPMPAGCGGTGIAQCLCGGDTCVCHNHGEVECPGCGACGDEELDFDFDDGDL
jgi:hypothetical protein